VDIYSIGLKVDSRQVKTAQKELGGMGRQAKGAGKSVQKFGRNVDKSSRNVEKMNKGLNLAKKALGGFAAALSVRQLQAFTEATLSAAQTTERQARSLGMTAEEFQKISFAFRQFGGDSSDISDAFNTLSDRAQDAKDGMQSFIDDFKLVGIEVDDLENKDPGELFRLFADGVASIDDPTRRAAGVVRILGDDVGRRLLPMLMDGTELLDDLGDQAEETGQILSNDLVEGGADAREAFRQLSQVLENDLQRVVLENADALKSIADSLQDTRDFVIENSEEFRVFGEVVGILVGFRLAKWALGAVSGIKSLAGAAALLTGPAAPFVALGGILATIRLDMLETKQETEEFAASIRDLTQAQLENAEQSIRAEMRSIQAQKDQLNMFDQLGPKQANRLAELGRQLGEVRDALEQVDNAGQKAGDSVSGVGDASPDAQEPQSVSGPEDLTNVVAGMRDLSVAMQEVLGTTVKIPGALDAASDSALGLSDIAKDMTDDLSNGLTDIIMQAKSAEEVFASLAKQIARTIIQQQIADPIAQGITGFASGLFGGGQAASASQPTMTTLPQNANGGNVFGGVPSIVGERGPEVFVPGQDGQIVPNHKMGGGGNVTVNVINQGGEQLEAQQQQTRRGPNGDTIVDVMVKKSMERLDSQGQLDGIFNRHGARRQGQF